MNYVLLEIIARLKPVAVLVSKIISILMSVHIIYNNNIVVLFEWAILGALTPFLCHISLFIKNIIGYKMTMYYEITLYLLSKHELSNSV